MEKDFGVMIVKNLSVDDKFVVVAVSEKGEYLISSFQTEKEAEDYVLNEIIKRDNIKRVGVYKRETVWYL